MLRRLKRRFIAMTMLLVGIVIFIVYAAVAGNFFLSVTQEVENGLKNAVYSREFDLFPSIGIHKDDGKNGNSDNNGFTFYSNSVCVVNYSPLGEITTLERSNAYISDDVLKEAVESVVADTDSFGQMSEYSLFYYKTDTIIGMRIAFCDSVQYFNYMKSILVNGAILCAMALAAFFAISCFLARTAMKPVEKSWEQQQNFIADASHELKTPLTVILANNNILQSHKDSTVAEQQKWIDSTYEEASHMRELVEDLLFLAKTDQQKIEKQFSSVDLSELSTRLALQFEPVAFEKGVTLDSEITDGIKIRGDSTAVNQMLHILVDNAVKYAGENGHVTLKLVKKQNYIYLSAKNSGKPIPPEDIPHIFERFYRSDKARTAGNGYGLGLSILKNLAELHKAEVSVTSNENDGTVFTVKFRAEKEK